MKVFPIDSDISCSCSPPQPQRQKRPRARANGSAASPSVHGRQNGKVQAITLHSDSDAEPAKAAKGLQPAPGRKQRRNAVISDSNSDEDFQPGTRAAGSRKSRKAAADSSPQSAPAAEQQNGASDCPRRNTRRQAAAANSASPPAEAATAVDFFMPLAQKKKKMAADKVAAEKAAAEAAAQAARDREAQGRREAEDARQKAAQNTAATFQQQLKRSAEDTAKINAGRTPHAFFERRAAQADAGAPKVKLVTELTTPPLPLLHITQADAAAFTYSTPETSMFRMDPNQASAGYTESPTAAEDSTVAAGSFALCCPHSAPAQATRTVSLSEEHPQQPAQQSLLEALAQHLAQAELPLGGGSNTELEDHPTPEQHLQRLRERLAQVSAARDAAAQDPSPAAAAKPRAAPLLPPSCGAHALWTERFQPRQPSQVCGNTAAVEELRSWLAAWQETATSAAETAQPSRPYKRSHARALLSDSDWSAGEADGDSDDDTWGGGTDRSNAVLLSGPVGSGKTAAAYAVAMAAGYCLIEVNPSVNRGGAQVQRLVGEATQSQRVALAGPAAAETADAAAAGPAASPPGGSDTKGSDSKPAKKPSAASSFFKLRKPAADSSANQPSTAGGGGKSEAAQTKHGMEAAAAAAAAAAASEQAPPPLTLLLFEEVDNLQEEDRGFIATLQELLATSKCPIIMTSNHSSPGGLLSGLTARIISFAPPSTSEILEQLVVMHEVDGAPATSLQHLMPLATACRGDLRQSILMAQMLRGCTFQEPSAAAAVPADDERSPIAEELDLRLQSFLQSGLEPAEHLRASIFVAAADAMQHRVGAAPCSRGSSVPPTGVGSTAIFGSLTADQTGYGDACAAWVEATDEALSDSTRALVSHLRDRRYERLATLRSIAAVQTILRTTPGGGGRTRSRGHRNYFEDSLALAASAAAELTNGCPGFSSCL